MPSGQSNKATTSWPKQFSVRTLLVAIALMCVVVAVGKAWLFPPELCVRISSTGDLRIDNQDIDSDALKTRLEQFMDERHGWFLKSHMVIIADPRDNGGRSEAVDFVAKTALDMNFDQVRMDWEGFDLKNP